MTAALRSPYPLVQTHKDVELTILVVRGVIP